MTVTSLLGRDLPNSEFWQMDVLENTGPVENQTKFKIEEANKAMLNETISC